MLSSLRLLSFIPFRGPASSPQPCFPGWGPGHKGPSQDWIPVTPLVSPAQTSCMTTAKQYGWLHWQNQEQTKPLVPSHFSSMSEAIAHQWSNELCLETQITSQTWPLCIPPALDRGEKGKPRGSHQSELRSCILPLLHAWQLIEVRAIETKQRLPGAHTAWAHSCQPLWKGKGSPSLLHSSMA